ncbi:MAG: HAD family hydrolase [Smithella sp.]|jgi:D,D-heptose 1,7-bisphosphate phosphatase
MKKNTAVFLDRDGTINEEVGYLDSLDKLKIIPRAYKAIRLINESGMKAVVISNQAGVARGLFTEDFVKMINEYLQTALRQKGAYIDNFYYCPHHPTEGLEPYRQVCECRKPAPGMLLQAAQDLNIDLTKSYLVGDRFNDMEAAKIAGVKGILVKTGFGQGLLQDDGPDRATPQNEPDFIAADILEAVKWILSQVASFG